MASLREKPRRQISPSPHGLVYQGLSNSFQSHLDGLPARFHRPVGQLVRDFAGNDDLRGYFSLVIQQE